jgi:nucleotide-binding universal stress UspA family protein
MYRMILVPLDGSAFSEHALPLALAVARRAGAGLHLVRVWPLRQGVHFDGVYLSPPEGEEEVICRCLSYLDAVMARLRDLPGEAVEITAEMMFGKPGSTLCDLTESSRFDLVVMTTHARSRLGRFFLGSVSDKMIRQSHLPLLLVRPEGEELNQAPDLSRVIVPLDGSPLAEKILEPAIELARLIPGCEIDLVRAVPATGPDEESDVADSETFRNAQKDLEAVADRLAAGGLKVQTHLVFEDRPEEAILNEATDRQAGLIAMETHGESGLSRLLHGSVLDKVLRSSHVPILVQRPVVI